MTREQISEFCVTSLANVLRVSKDRIETGTKFTRLGLDSAMLIYVI
jgi:acyl carrier protein